MMISKMSLPCRRLNLLYHVTGMVIFLLSTAAVPAQEAEKSIELSDRRELFVDSWLIDEMDSARLLLHAPIDEGPVVHFDKPWEGQFCGYCTVIRDGELLRLYYRGRPEKGADGDIGEVTCYAESFDGRNWTKPNVNQFVIN